MIFFLFVLGDYKKEKIKTSFSSFYNHPHSRDDADQHSNDEKSRNMNDSIEDLKILKACNDKNQAYLKSQNKGHENHKQISFDNSIDNDSIGSQNISKPSKSESDRNAAKKIDDENRNKYNEFISSGKNKNNNISSDTNDKSHHLHKNLDDSDDDSDNDSNFYSFPGHVEAAAPSPPLSLSLPGAARGSSSGQSSDIACKTSSNHHPNMPHNMSRFMEEKDSSDSCDTYTLNNHKSDPIKGKKPVWDDNKRVVYVDQNVPDSLYRPTGLRKAAHVKYNDTKYDLNNVASSSYGKRQVHSQRGSQTQREKQHVNGNISSRVYEKEIIRDIGGRRGEKGGRSRGFVPPPLPSEENRP